jgi:hypothetical protein
MAKQTFTTGQVLTAAQMTNLQQTAMLGGAPSAKVASYVLVAADAGGAITMSNAGATTITVNTGLFAAGDVVNITNLGAGTCTITAGTATVNTASSLALAQYESGILEFISASSAVFVKSAGAAANSMTLLSTTTLSGTSTTISSISQAYTNLAIYISAPTFSAAAALRVKLYNNNNSKTSGVFGATAASIGTGFIDFSNTTTQADTMTSWLELKLYTTNNIGIAGGHYGGTTNLSSSFGGADSGAGVNGMTNIVVTTIAGTSTFTAGTCRIYGVK